MEAYGEMVLAAMKPGGEIDLLVVVYATRASDGAAADECPVHVQEKMTFSRNPQWGNGDGHGALE